MRISTTITPAIKRKLHGCLLSGVLVCILCCTTAWAVSAEKSQEAWRESVVRISLRYESAVFFESKYVSQSRVIEITDFPGIVVDARGFIITYVGSHWLKMGGAQSRLVVEFADGKSEAAKLVGVDERVDLAVVESPGAAARAVTLGSSLDQKHLDLASSTGGKWVTRALCPVGIHSHPLFPERTLKARLCEAGSDPFDARGSLVMDRKGRFLGVVTSVETAGVSKSVKSYRVISTDILNESLRRLVTQRKNLKAGYLGIYGDTETSRVVITGVERNTPAGDAGILAGDVIVAVDSHPIRNLMEFGKVLRWMGPGGRPELTIEREDGVKKIRPELTSYPERKPVYAWKLEVPRVWGEESAEEEELKISPMPLPSHFSFGLVVDTLSPQLASYFKAPNGRGLLVTSVLKESLASKSGFQAGDVLIEINGTELSSPSIMREALHAGKDGVIKIRFLRGGTLQSRRLVFP